MGGNAVAGVGAIHISEINPTLRRIETDLGLPMNDLDNRLIGSVGKKEYSGDIDLVFPPLEPAEMKIFSDKLRTIYGQQSVRKNGNMYNVSVPITRFDFFYADRLPRTGFVQVDFIFAEEQFTKLFNYSPGDESKYKGVHRNLALSSISAWVDRRDSVETDDQGRPVEKIRWKWSSLGFFKIRRYSRKDANGAWLKTQADEQIGTAKFDPLLIAEIMFGDGAQPSDLDSLETVIAACKKYYDEDRQAKVFDTLAHNLAEYNRRSPKVNLESYGVPIEIQPFMSRYDK